jgi:hypothetical protein
MHLGAHLYFNLCNKVMLRVFIGGRKTSVLHGVQIECILSEIVSN